MSNLDPLKWDVWKYLWDLHQKEPKLTPSQLAWKAAGAYGLGEVDDDTYYPLPTLPPWLVEMSKDIYGEDPLLDWKGLDWFNPDEETPVTNPRDSGVYCTCHPSVQVKENTADGKKFYVCTHCKKERL